MVPGISVPRLINHTVFCKELVRVSPMKSQLHGLQIIESFHIAECSVSYSIIAENCILILQKSSSPFEWRIKAKRKYAANRL